jgi:hypothetical protein
VHDRDKKTECRSNEKITFHWDSYFMLPAKLGNSAQPVHLTADHSFAVAVATLIDVPLQSASVRADEF